MIGLVDAENSSFLKTFAAAADGMLIGMSLDEQLFEKHASLAVHRISRLSCHGLSFIEVELVRKLERSVVSRLGLGLFLDTVNSMSPQQRKKVFAFANRDLSRYGVSFAERDGRVFVARVSASGERVECYFSAMTFGDPEFAAEQLGVSAAEPERVFEEICRSTSRDMAYGARVEADETDISESFFSLGVLCGQNAPRERVQSRRNHRSGQ